MGLSVLALAFLLSLSAACELDRPILENTAIAAVRDSEPPRPAAVASDSYEAARSAARAGDYRQSIFHLQAAASGGFAEIADVMSDPLFRPLRSGSHWQLVIDLIDANAQVAPPKTVPPVDSARII